MQPLLHDGHQHVHGNGNPDLSLYGVLACSVKILDPEMLFDPFEEQFHPPATFVELSNDEGRKGKIVGQKNKNLVCFGIVIFDAAKLVRVIFFGVKVFQKNCLIADKAGCFVDFSGFDSFATHVGFGSGHKECQGFGNPVEAFEIQVAPVHDVEGTDFQNEFVQNIDIVDLAVCNADECWDRAPQVQKSVKFDGSLFLAKAGPGKKIEAQIDGGRIEGISGFFQLHTEAVAHIQGSCDLNQNLGEVCIDAPISLLIGVCQCVAENLASNAHVIKFVLLSLKAGFYIAETLPVSELRAKKTLQKIEGREKNYFFF